METLTYILEDVYSIHNNALGSFEEELLGMKESFGHPLDLLIVMVVNLTTVVEHIANI